MRNHWIKRGIGITCAAIAGAFLFGFVVMYLWNWLMPELFGIKEITYWQAFGVLVLSKILFGGFKGKNGCSGCGCGGGHRGHWRSRWKEKWEGMSEEERAKVRSWCGWDCEPETEKK